MRDWFAGKAKAGASTYEKLGNREPHRIEAEDDTAASGNFGGRADWKLAAKSVKQAPRDPSVINQAFAKGGLKSGKMKSPGEKYVRSQMMPKANDSTSLLALDHGLLFNYKGGIRTRPDRDGLAFDLRSVRSYTDDGYLNVEVSNISKATVNPYLGREIPGWENMGLDPNRIYNLFRDPDELERAAPTFNNLPILNQHMPVSSEAFPEDSIIGTTGTDAEFDKTYLTNSLAFWKKKGGIADLENNKKRELSSAYRYTPDMTPGAFQGQRYDGVMRNIIGNHVALVEEGRAGPDVMVGDSMEAVRMAKKPQKQMSARAAIAMMVVGTNLRPKLAADSKLNLRPLFKGVTAANYNDRKPEILKGLRASLKLRTILAADRRPVSAKKAMDATIGEVAELLDMIESHGVEKDHQLGPAQMSAVEPGAEVSAPAPAAPPSQMNPEAELAGQEEAEGGMEEGGGGGNEIAQLLAGKVDEATLAKVLELAGGGESSAPPEEGEGESEEEDEGDDSMPQGGEKNLKSLGAAGDELLEEDPNAEKGTGTGKGSPGAGSGEAEDDRDIELGAEDEEDEEAEDEVVLSHEHEPGKGGPAKDKRMGKDTPPPFKGMPKTGGKMVGDKRLITMDQANVLIKRALLGNDATIKKAVEKERNNQRSIREAEGFVRPWVGELPDLSFDSAGDVYRAALEALGMDSAELDDIHPSAYRALVMARPKPGERREQRRNPTHMASDSAKSTAKTYAERFPNATRIKHM